MDTQSSSHLRELDAEIRKYDLSPGASAWLSKVLYPPGPGTAVSFPDGAYTPSVRADYRPSTVVEAPAGLAPEDTWDCCIVLLPGNNNAAVIQSGLSGVVNFQTGTGVVSSWLRNVDVGATLAVPVGSRTNAGVATTISWNTTVSSSRPTAFRSTYKSLTVHMTASSLYDGGSVTAAQIPIDWHHSSAMFLAQRNSLNSVALAAWGALPLSESQIRQLAPASHVGEARTGVYMPLRLKGPVQPFVSAIPCGGQSYWPTGSTNEYVSLPMPSATSLYMPVAAYASTGFAQADGWTATLSSLGTGGGSGVINDPLAVDDTNYDNFNTGVVIFRGLSPLATLTVQVYQGIEMVVSPNSPLVSFSRSPDPRDDKAIAAYSQAVSRLGYVYPAKYNFLASALPLIVSALRLAAPYVLPALRTAATTLIPMAASAALSAVKRDAAPPRRAIVASPDTSARPRSASAASARTVRVLGPTKARRKRR